jgi:hypothetical protein
MHDRLIIGAAARPWQGKRACGLPDWWIAMRSGWAGGFSGNLESSRLGLWRRHKFPQLIFKTIESFDFRRVPQADLPHLELLI